LRHRAPGSCLAVRAKVGHPTGGRRQRHAVESTTYQAGATRRGVVRLRRALCFSRPGSRVAGCRDGHIRPGPPGAR
jgi:hypothetical protein